MDFNNNRRRKQSRISEGFNGQQRSNSLRFSAETVQSVSRILEVCGLVPYDNYDHGDNDNYWMPEDVPEILKNLEVDDQIESIDFNLDLEWFSAFLRAETENKVILPLDFAKPFDKNCKNGSNKRAFCIDLHNVMAQSGIKFSQINKVFEVFERHQSSLDLPIVQKNPLLKKSKTASVKENIRAYVGKDNRTVVIDVCQNDCIAFHGIQQIKGKLIDCSKEIICPVCYAHRYSHCKSCADLSYSQCNPFTYCQDVKTKNGFGHSDRFPEKSLYYRPITSKLLNLYKLSLVDGNEGLLNYFQEKYRVSRPG